MWLPLNLRSTRFLETANIFMRLRVPGSKRLAKAARAMQSVKIISAAALESLPCMRLRLANVQQRAWKLHTVARLRHWSFRAALDARLGSRRGTPAQEAIGHSIAEPTVNALPADTLATTATERCNAFSRHRARYGSTRRKSLQMFGAKPY
jgi:hypothetical protein